VIEEARRVFPNTHVARDFDHYAVRRDGLEKMLPENRRPQKEEES
jgi:hypothetical protein